MASYESDSSEDGGTHSTTTVMLGYTSKEPTDDDFSQLGGSPTWPDATDPPSADLAKCKICNSLMCLLLQLNTDLPSRFHGHERRLYIFACGSKPCRRKAGSIRALRGTKAQKVVHEPGKSKKTLQQASAPSSNLGDSIFNSSSQAASSAANPISSNANSAPHNPFSPQQPENRSNPFAPPSAQSANVPLSRDPITDLPSTFAQKAQISSPSPVRPSRIPWPTTSFLKPYPSYHLDAETEYLDPCPPPSASSSKMAIDDENVRGEDSDRDIFESNLDKTFQRFADRLAQNPEQVLRYEFAGTPLLYSKIDALGKLFSPGPPPSSTTESTKVKTQARAETTSMPNCSNCGKKRVFECQLVPHAIVELEAEETGLDGMDWGTVIVGVCEVDCMERGVGVRAWGWVEEWVGVQWEEMGRGAKIV